MPIYAYRCADCGHTKDVLQKLSDPPLTDCPACGAVAFSKQITAAGFQLKGSGWYATDFKGGQAKPAQAPGAPGDAAAPATTAPAESGPAPASKAAEAAPAAPGGACGSSCACH